VFRFRQSTVQSINTGVLEWSTMQSMRRRFVLRSLFSSGAGRSGDGGDRITIATGAMGACFSWWERRWRIFSASTFPGDARRRPATGWRIRLEIIHRGEATIGWLVSFPRDFDVRGQREFRQEVRQRRLVMAAMDSGQSIVTLADSGIKTFADVKGCTSA